MGMTRKEAKEFIAQSVKSDVDMALVADAIKALEQELTNNYLENGCIDKWEDVDGKKVEAWIVKGKIQIRHRGAIHNFALPSVILQEPTTKNGLGVDCISREAVIDGIKEYFHDEYYQRTSIQDCRDCFIEDVLNNLPSVTPQEPKTGHWIMTGDYYTGAYGDIDYVKCSCCGEDSLEEGDYCPNCGAKMVEPQESKE